MKKLNTEKSHSLFEEAKKYMPGGVNSPVRAYQAVKREPLFIKRAEKGYIYDVDGNSYVDFVCSWGPGILGHSHPQVIAAVQKACEDGLTFGAPTEKETILAKLISSLMTSMEMMRLVNSGTEAVMSVVRAARGFTGKNKVIKFNGCYHGHSDCMLVKAGSGLLTQSIPSGAGVPENCTKDTLIAEYNDISSVEKLIESNKGEIACVIIEPVAANMGVVPPKKEFLQELRKLTEDNGILLIFDEVITGFRLALGGAQEYYGVKPDLTSLGKIAGGGMPLAVYGGRRDIMENVAPVGKVYQAGTLSGNPIAVTAGIETLKILSENKNIYTELEKKSEILEKAFKDSGFNVNRVGSLLCPFFTDRKVESYTDALSSDTEKYAKYFSFMLEKGIYIAPSQFEAMFVSYAHTDEDIEKTAACIREAGKYMF